MGVPRGGGYEKLPALDKGQLSGLQQMLQQGLGNQQQASQGYQQILSGGGADSKPIIEDAQRRFQQHTIPQIMNAFGANNKGSSALNQALAAGGADLNSNLAAQLSQLQLGNSQLQLGAAQGLGGLGQSQGQLGATTPTFAYLQKQPPLWQQLLGPLIGGASQLGGAALGRPNINFGGQQGQGQGFPATSQQSQPYKGVFGFQI